MLWDNIAQDQFKTTAYENECFLWNYLYTSEKYV